MQQQNLSPKHATPGLKFDQDGKEFEQKMIKNNSDNVTSTEYSASETANPQNNKTF
jgi:hypothetical protein